MRDWPNGKWGWGCFLGGKPHRECNGSKYQIVICEFIPKRYKRINKLQMKYRMDMLKNLFGNISGGSEHGYLKEAIYDYSAGNLQSALSNIDKTIETVYVNHWTHFAFRANVHEDLGEYEKAIKDYELAISHSVNDVNVYALYSRIGFCSLNLGYNNKAVEFYSRAIELKLQHPDTEDNPDQEGLYKGVLFGTPFKKMYNNRACAKRNIGKLDEAIEDCMKSLRYDKNYSVPYFVLAQTYDLLGQKKKAIEFLKISGQLGNRKALSVLREIGLA